MHRKLAGLVLLVAMIAAVAFGPAIAQVGDPAWPKPLTGSFEIGAGSALGSATYSPVFTLSSLGSSPGWSDPDVWQDPVTGKWHTSYYYDVAEETPLTTEGGDIIGYIDSLSIAIDEDPAVAVSFSCRAGSLDTVFTFTNFLTTTLMYPTGLASASITAQDRNSNGVTVTGLYDGGNCYQAAYNSGTLFTSLVSGGSATAGHSYSSGSYDYGPVMVGEPVSYMEANYHFSLSARDTAAGVSNFQMDDPAPAIPEPGSLLALGSGLLGLIGFARRRRD